MSKLKLFAASVVATGVSVIGGVVAGYAALCGVPFTALLGLPDATEDNRTALLGLPDATEDNREKDLRLKQRRYLENRWCVPPGIAYSFLEQKWWFQTRHRPDEPFMPHFVCHRAGFTTDKNGVKRPGLKIPICPYDLPPSRADDLVKELPVVIDPDTHYNAQSFSGNGGSDENLP